MKSTRKNLLYMAVIVMLVAMPLAFIKNSEFGGADGQAEDVISKVNPGYKVWAQSPIKPPGGETESLLFALQAAMGSGVVFFILGYYKGRRDSVNRRDS